MVGSRQDVNQFLEAQMRSSDFLFQLIKSLNKGDRRNFKLFARLQDGDKKYVQLFDAIDKQSKYDEKKLLKQFEGERFTKQFSVAKNYLYNYILKTLDIFHQDKPSQLRVLIHKIEILMGKNLYDQAQKLLRKAKHASYKQERFGDLLEILNHQRHILHHSQQTKMYEAFVADIQREEREALEKLKNIQQFMHLYDELYRLRKRSDSIRGENEKEELEAILSDELMQGPEKALTVRSRLKQLDIMIDSSRFKHDNEACIKYCRQKIATYDEHPELREEQNLKYIEVQYNYGILHYLLGSVDDAVVALKRLRETKTFNEQETVKVVEMYFSFKLGLCIESFNLEEGLSTIEDFEKEFSKRLSGKLMKSFELTIYYLIATFYVWIDRPSDALAWINKILNEPRTELRTDLQGMARILNLVIHYELGNFDLMEYHLKSASRFLANRDRLFGFERVNLKYLRQLAMLGPDGDSQDVFLSYSVELNKVLEDKFEQRALQLFDAPIWVGSHLQGVSPWAYAREKVKA